MRLTLRTLLAYLDEILDPSDQEDIGSKIQESQFATELVRRSRDVVRRLRLDAPQLSGRGMGLDPNTVAEYLDNTLASERVAELERVCLESDVHLAEVAACHQILTLILGQPAEVEPDSRMRMYGLQDVSGQLDQGQLDAGSEIPAVEPLETSETLPKISFPNGSSVAERGRPEVPDYLRDSGRSKFAAAVVVVLFAAALGGLGYLAFGPPRLLQQLTGGPPVGDPIDGGAPLTDPSETSPALLPSLPAEEREQPVDGREDSDLQPPDEAADSDVALPAEPVEQPPPDSAPELPAEDLNVPSIDASVDSTPGVADNVTERMPADGSLRQPAVPAEIPTVAVTTSIDPQPEPASVTDAGGVTDAGEPTVEPAEPVVDALLDDAAGAEGEAAELGIYISEDDVLLRYDDASDQWFRLPPRAPVLTGNKLLALPTFRPTITLVPGITVQLAGGTAVVVDRPAGESMPQVELLYGRLLLLSDEPQSNRMALKLGEQQHVIEFGELGTSLAVQLTRQLTPGSAPHAEESPEVVHFFATSGQLRWEFNGGQFPVQSPDQWVVIDGKPRSIASEGALPDWIDSPQLSVSERRASFDLVQDLQLDRSANVVLRELVDRLRAGRRVETRSLASRSLIYLGQFGPFIKALNDLDQRVHWFRHIETLRESLALGPEVAARIKQAFIDERGETSGEALYGMLWAYGPENLTADQANELVDHLDNERADYRVLAFWNLKQITGAGLNYHPEYSEVRRQQSVRRWRERVAEEFGAQRTP